MTGVAPELGELAALIEQNAGNVVPETHYPFLDRILLTRMRAVGLETRRDYVEALREGRLEEEWAQLLPQITIKESYLFRTPQHFAAVETLLPGLLEKRAGERRLDFWSAGCAHGEEAATLAVVLAEQRALQGWDWRIVATDVDETALAVARRSTFAGRAMARVPPPLVERWFVARGPGYQLHPELRARIEFRTVNLVHEPYPFGEHSFALIFLRNVLIYFRPELQRQVVTSVVRRLAADGVLFVGPSESLWQLELPLAPVEHDGCFGYVRATVANPPHRRGDRVVPRNETAAPAGAAASGGRDRLPSSGERVSAATAAAGTRAKPAPTGLPAAPAGVTQVPVASDPPNGARAPAAAVGEAAPLALAVVAALGRGDLAAATAAVVAALAVEPTSAVLRGLEGLALDLGGDGEGALRAYRAALFLEPQLFQVRLVCADLSRRSGDAAAAHRHYREALRTLQGAGGVELPGTGSLWPDRLGAERRCEAALRAVGGSSGAARR